MLNIFKRATVLLSALYLSACSITPAEQKNLSGTYSDIPVTVVKQGDSPIDFTLENTTGGKINLQQTLKNNHVLLIFYRGDWCPYCIDQFSTIQPVLPELKQYGVKLIAISPDKLSAAQNTQRQFGQGYTFLMDPELKTSQAYGVHTEKDVPHPAVFLIEQATSVEQSKIVWMYASTDHTVRPNGEQLLKQVQSLFDKSN